MSSLGSGAAGGAPLKHRLDDDGAERKDPPHLHALDSSTKKLKHSASLNNPLLSSAALYPPSSPSPSSSPSSSLNPSSSSPLPPPLPSSSSPSANKASFQSFVASFTPLTAELLSTQIPQRILELHRYISDLPAFYPAITPPSLSSPSPIPAPTFSDTSPPPPPPVQPITSPILPHPLLTLLLPYLHSSLSLLLQHLASLKLHLQLLIPPIDASPSFHLDIQDEAIAELTRHEDAAFATLERIPAYVTSRAKVGGKVVKWPGVEDYWLAMGELDEGMWLDVRQGLCEVREAYVAVWDMYRKNEERLKDPEGEKYHRNMAM